LFVMIGLLAACLPPTGAPAEPNTSQTATQATGAEAAKYGGTYRAMFGNDAPSMDDAAPSRWQDWWARFTLLYNQLYTYDQDGQFVAELATALPAVSADGLVYTIPLRQGVKFHDGTLMTAHDVKFSFDRLLWPELGNPFAGQFANIAGSDAVVQGDSKEISGIEVVDEFTLRITLKERQAVFAMFLTGPGIVSQKAVEAAGADWGVKTVIGTGPFKLGEWLPGDKITFERHAEYFKTGLPYLDRVELYLNVPEEARVLRWESGEAEYIDYFDGVQAGELPRIQNDPALAPLVRMIETPIFDYFQIADNVAPFTDLRVRQAIAMAIDKQALADSTGMGASVPMDDIYTNFMPMYQPDFVSDYQYDPAAAKQLLAEAGFPDGIKNVDMYVDFHPYQGAIVQADLAKIGIEVNILDGEPALYQDKISSGEIPLVFTGYGPGIMDGSDTVSYVFGCAGEALPSRTQYCTDEMRQLFNQANTMELTDPKRNELFHRIQEIAINETAYLTPVYKRNVLGLGQSYVKNETYFFLPLLEEVYLDPQP
jgi:ABC-type transport system substrate-binding protein